MHIVLPSSWTGHSECPAIAHFTNCVLEAPSSWTGRFHRLGVTYISRYSQKLIKLSNFSVDNVHIKPSSSVRNVGTIFDNIMWMTEQVTAICRTTHYHLRNIGPIRKCNSMKHARSFHAHVTSRLDCGNGNLYDLHDFQNYHLQRILHIAKRIPNLIVSLL